MKHVTDREPELQGPLLDIQAPPCPACGEPMEQLGWPRKLDEEGVPVHNMRIGVFRCERRDLHAPGKPFEVYMPATDQLLDAAQAEPAGNATLKALEKSVLRAVALAPLGGPKP